jgi:hypothetical protein
MSHTKIGKVIRVPDVLHKQLCIVEEEVTGEHFTIKNLTITELKLNDIVIFQRVYTTSFNGEDIDYWNIIWPF